MSDKGEGLAFAPDKLAAPGFLTTNPIPEGVLEVTLPPQHTTDKATPSHPAIKEEEKEEEVVEVSDSKDDFKVFNRPQSPEVLIGDFGHLPLVEVKQMQGNLSVPEAMGIQRKAR